MLKNPSSHIENLHNLTPEKENYQCPNCQGKGKIQPYGSLRLSNCQKCQGTGFLSN